MNRKKISNDPFGFGFKPIKAPNFKLPKNNSFDYGIKKLTKVTPIDFGYKIPRTKPIKLAKIKPIDFGFKPIQTNPTKLPKTNPVFGGTINTQTNAYRKMISTSMTNHSDFYKTKPHRVVYPTPKPIKLSDYYRANQIRPIYTTVRPVKRQEIRPLQRVESQSSKMSLLDKLIKLDQLAQEPNQEARFSQIHNELANSKKQINDLIDLVKEIKEEKISVLKTSMEIIQQTLDFLLEKYDITKEQLIGYLDQDGNNINVVKKPQFEKLMEQVQKLADKQQELDKFKADIEHLHRTNNAEAKDTSLS